MDSSQTNLFMGVKGNDMEKLKNSLWLMRRLIWKESTGNHVVKVE